MVYRIFVEKKKELDNEAKSLLNEAKHLLGIEKLENIRLFKYYFKPCVCVCEWMDMQECDLSC